MASVNTKFVVFQAHCSCLTCHIVRLECSGNAEDVDQKQYTRRRYTFHVGSSWAAKPKMLIKSFDRTPHSPDTKIGSWRDDTLTTSTRKFSGGIQRGAPGEDFFFIQEVNSASLSVTYTNFNRFS